jgi:hypothetical protein
MWDVMMSDFTMLGTYNGIVIFTAEVYIMIRFTATIRQFAEQGEKTGWTYIEVPEDLALQLKPGNKKSFRVKGKLDDYAFAGMALIPFGNGNFILALNAAIRKSIHKQKGAMLKVQMTEDTGFKVVTPEDLLACLEDEPKSLAAFNKMPLSHQHYYIKWIDSAKTEPTRTKRIAMTVDALSKGMDYGEMLRSARDNRSL